MFSDVTKLELINCHIEWKIHDFVKHEKYMEHGQFLTSKQFYNPKCPSVKWELRAYLNTTQLNSNNLVSLVQVGLKDSDDALKAKFTIGIKNNGGKVNCCSATTSFKHQLESDKYSLTKIMPNRPLTIFCDVEFMPYKLKLENEFEDFPTPKNSFIDIFNKGIFTDCVFEISFFKDYLLIYRFVWAVYL
uniref:MATH domain-containing protein n=1 Tax=Meloidogyne enterolobii TaxID=390850 RepID=A0A6V7URQ2_MELEN|nr:unnamed protein product [Meloidogyne enterolobii]